MPSMDFFMWTKRFIVLGVAYILNEQTAIDYWLHTVTSFSYQYVASHRSHCDMVTEDIDIDL